MMLHRPTRAGLGLALFAVFALTASGPAQTAAKKRPLKHSDYAAWRSVQGPQLSPDGVVVAYALAPQEGDGEFVARHLKTGKEYRHPRGVRPPLAVTGARAATGAPPRGTGPQFTPDGKLVAFPIYPTQAETAKVKPPAAPPRDALGVMDLATGKVTRIDAVRAFGLPEEGPAVLVYHVAPPGAARTTPDAGTPTTPPRRPGGTRPAGTTAPARTTPSNLVVRDLANGKERTFADVTDFSLSKDGRCLVYTVTSKKEADSGVFVVDPRAGGAPVALKAGPGRYGRPVWDEKQTQLAFLYSAAVKPPERPKAKLCHWRRPESAAGKVALASPAALALSGVVLLAASPSRPAGAVDLEPVGKAAFREGWEVSEGGSLTFSADGARLFFGLVPPPPKAGPKAEGEEANVELWHWKDDFILPMRKVRANTERLRTYRGVFHLTDRTSLQLADEKLAETVPAPVGDWALGMDDGPYRILVGQDTSYADYHLVNLKDGTRKQVLKKQHGGVTWSPGGRYLLAHDAKGWKSVAVPSGKVTHLTAKLKAKFAWEEYDMPGPPPPYGVAGWTAGDKHVLLYDRYDVWMVAPDGSEAKNLTAGVGRKGQLRLRVVRFDAPPGPGGEAPSGARPGRTPKALDPAKPLLLRAENERTRDTGFYSVGFDGQAPAHLLSGARNYGVPVKAKKGDALLLLTVSTFYDFPDLFVTDASFRELRRVTNANPHKKDLLWGKSELVRYKNADGVALSGVLIKPEDFDAKKKYPMIVYIYERLSDRLHAFSDPRPGTSINPAYYASNGYLVFMPDIAYTVGYPGQSALKCVLPGIQAVADKGCVKEDAIGIQGHSWGGYQIAYMITQTTRFKAAAAGAPVSNMTSAYGGIRWGTGLSRQFQYERTQSRIGGTLWEYPTRFLENSPVFQADRVKTPLLMLHNDQDDAVPWYQGIEYYMALRRLGKEVYLVNYPGEAHGIRRRVNQKDYTVRMQQFFDHHLKGAPQPEWMKKGLPYKPPAGGAGRPGRTAGPAATPGGE